MGFVLIAMLVAYYLTRNTVQDLTWKARGEDPPSFRREQARWERRQARAERRGDADGPGREFWRNVWGDAVASAEERRERFAARRGERRRTKWADKDAAAAEDAAYDANDRLDAAAGDEPPEPRVRTGRCYFCQGEFPAGELWPARDDDDLSVDACHPCWHARNRKRPDDQPADPVEPAHEAAEPEQTAVCGECGQTVPFRDSSLIYVNNERLIVCPPCRLRLTEDKTDEPEPTSVDPVADDAGDAEVIQFADWQRPAASTTEKESTLSAEITGLQSSIAYAEGSAAAAERAANQDEMALATLRAGGVTGAAITGLETTMDGHNMNASHYRAVAAELRAQLQVKEAYEANQGAGEKQFVTSE